MFLFSNPYYKGPVSDHFDGKRFFNPWPHSTPSLIDVFKWKMKHKATKWPKQLSKITPEFLAHKQLDGVRACLIGHASVLLQIEDCNILLDPTYALYAGPLKTKMLKRRSAFGVHFDHLPRIDVVLISHSHYDHLDKKTLLKLTKKHSPLFIVPLGVDKLLQSLGIKAPSIALDWYQSAHFRHLSFTLTKAQHWSARTAFDRNMTLWGGFMIESKEKRVYFAGDTGYHQPMFKQIHDLYGAPDLAILPIGAYKPRWFMQGSHMDPYEAALAHLDLQAKKSLAIHHRCFPLADEGPYDAEKDLHQVLPTLGIPQGAFLTPLEGEAINI